MLNQLQVKDEESQTEEIVKSIQTTGGLAQKAKETYSQRCQVSIYLATTYRKWPELV